MGLTLYNTATRQKETFQPLEPGKVKMYACGPTVYDYFHVGNARAFIVFDTLRRVLQRREYAVTYVQNITDIDDKIINRAHEENLTPDVLAEKYTAAFFEDVQALGCLAADRTPKATEHMSEIVELISRLVEKNQAYVVEGDVFFSVRQFSDYGRISGKNIDELKQGARVDVDQRKKDPLDFSLWKTAKAGEPAWDSPWGRGRPGWHLECSAMSMKYLGDQFDIHGGGADLIFPHHENENAQSESLTGKPLARYWMHNGYLKTRGEKMSKSLGNFWVTRDVLKLVPAQVLRLFMLSAHYRSPLDFNPENLEAARQGYQELRKTLERLHELLRLPVEEDFRADETAVELDKDRRQAREHFEAALDDDLNTAEAAGQIYTLANRTKQVLAGRPERTRELFQVLGSVNEDLMSMTGVLGVQPEVVSVPEDVLKLVQNRQTARTEKDWATSDRIRDQIINQGYMLEDTPFGTLALREETEVPDLHKLIQTGETE